MFLGVKIHNTRNLLYFSFLFLVTFNGFLLAFFEHLSIHSSGWLFSIIGFALTIYFILFSLEFSKPHFTIIIICLIWMIGIAIRNIFFFNSLDINSLYIYISYYVTPVAVLIGFGYCISINNTINYLRILGLITVVIAYVQLLFGSSLPNNFLLLPGLSRDLIGVISLGDHIINTPNGLIGNAMIFGAFLNIIFILCLHFFYKNKSILNLFFLILTWLMIFLQFSRVALVGSIISIIIYFYFNNHLHRFLINSLLLSIILFFSLLVLYGTNPAVEYTVDRLLGLHPNAVESTAIHVEDYKKVIALFYNSPFIGAPLGHDFSDRIITDGAWFQYFLDMGIFIFIIYLFFWFYIFAMIIKSIINDYRRDIAIILFSAWIYFSLANFFNSSFLAKINSVYFMVLLSIFLSNKTYFKANNKENIS